MKTVITYGTFDLFHIGHVNLLKRARSLGDRLVVAVSTDEFNQGKGKTTLVPYEHRVAILESCRYVDKVIPENDWAQKRDDIKSENADVFVMGDDWKGKFDELSDLCEVIYLDRTKDISSTAMKQAIMVFTQLQKDLL
ncbi:MULTISPECIES: glycerol-3-phosphate cytidylyltransferase [Gammaproteobacteria]|uniref:glycerol-3-phosphate cytidylyltransferase n=1 Tax=Gammaproteobacteria TaxID=1236 RepID=UPI000DD0DFBA|nr:MULTISPECIES: glycerol-3-phosphate cytidylyltransferase [Gammaproteobacteria]RTE86837.1 glycerol-3-phosphate cytidylyltransferase [Aliidiomarina sp. B3213]TCZ93374.1 glycerol-3-phosphate cytidylyltransferase [Lysobacter sp. N42]